MRRDTTDLEHSAITAIGAAAHRHGIRLQPGDARRLALAAVGALTTGSAKHRRRATVTTGTPLTPKAGATPDDARRIAAQLEVRRAAPLPCRCADLAVWLHQTATCPNHPEEPQS